MIRATRTLAAVALLAAVAGCAGAPPDWAEGAQSAASASPIGLESALRLGEAAAAGGDFASALNILGAAAANHPTEAAPRRALAETFFRAGSFPEARRSWSEYRTLSGATAEAETGLGRIALATGDAAGAEAHFRAALAADPESVAAMNGAAVALDLRGRHVEARKLYDAALSRRPDDRALLTNRALSMALAGDAGSAVRALDELSQGPTRLPQSLHNLALAHALNGETGRAADILTAELPPEEAAANLAFYKRLRR